MFLGAIPLTFYHSLLATRDIHSLRSEQVIMFIKVLTVYILFIACWLFFRGIYNEFGTALRYSAFNVVSIVTSTGFVSTDYLKWGAFASTAFIVFALTGGCTGSTAGSIKIYRWQIVFAQLKKSLITTTEPNRMVPMKIGSAEISSAISSSIFVFLAAYCLSVIALSLMIALTGLEFETAFSAVIACITNSGPGIGKIIGPSGNYSSLSDIAKWLLAFTMLLGRLEVMTIIVIFTRSFWR